jgi:trigger factor
MMADKNNKKNNQETPEEIKNIVKIEDSGPCKKKITVEVPEEKIKSILDSKYVELRKEAVLPGFRKGRAPIRLLEKRFGTDIRNQVKLQLLAESADAAIKDNKIDTLGDPNIKHEDIKLPDSGPLIYSFDVEVRPEFELPNLEGIEIRKPKTEITDQRVDEEIEAMRKRSGMWTPKEDQGVTEGDQVVADVVLKMEGSEDLDKHDNTEIFVREPGFAAGVPIEGLVSLLKGSRHGDEKSITVDVPATYFNEQFRGKKVEVKITIKEIKQLQPAELNAEFLGRFGVENPEELKSRIREFLSANAEREARTAMADQVYAYLQEKTTFDLPADIVADQALSILQRQYVNLLMRGTPKEQVEEQMEQLKASSDQQAKDQLKLFFIMSKIADLFKVEVTEEEINGHIAMIAAQRGRRPEKMRDELARDGSLAQFTFQVREQKCIEKILEKANIIEGEPEAVRKPEPRKHAVKKAAPKTAAPKAKEKEEEKPKSRTETEAKRKPKAEKKTGKKEK